MTEGERKWSESKDFEKRKRVKKGFLLMLKFVYVCVYREVSPFMPSMNPGPVLRLQSKLRTILPKGFIAKFLWRGELKHEKNAEGLKL